MDGLPETFVACAELVTSRLPKEPPKGARLISETPLVAIWDQAAGNPQRFFRLCGVESKQG